MSFGRKTLVGEMCVVSAAFRCRVGAGYGFPSSASRQLRRLSVTRSVISNHGNVSPTARSKSVAPYHWLPGNGCKLCCVCTLSPSTNLCSHRAANVPLLPYYVDYTMWPPTSAIVHSPSSPSRSPPLPPGPRHHHHHVQLMVQWSMQAGQGRWSDAEARCTCTRIDGARANGSRAAGVHRWTAWGKEGRAGRAGEGAPCPARTHGRPAWCQLGLLSQPGGPGQPGWSVGSRLGWGFHLPNTLCDFSSLSRVFSGHSSPPPPPPPLFFPFSSPWDNRTGWLGVKH